MNRKLRIKTDVGSTHKTKLLDEEILTNKKIIKQMKIEYMALKSKLQISDSAALKLEYDEEIDKTK